MDNNKAIVIKTVKYSENYLIVKLLDKKNRIDSCIYRISNKNKKKNLLFPCSIIEYKTSKRKKKSLPFMSDIINKNKIFFASIEKNYLHYFIIEIIDKSTENNYVLDNVFELLENVITFSNSCKIHSYTKIKLYFIANYLYRNGLLDIKKTNDNIYNFCINNSLLSFNNRDIEEEIINNYFKQLLNIYDNNLKNWGKVFIN